MSVGALVYTFIATRRKDVDGRVAELSTKVGSLNGRTAALEQTVAALPGQADIHKLELLITQMNGSMGRMEAVLEGNAKIMTRLESIVSRHENHLLEGAKR